MMRNEKDLHIPSAPGALLFNAADWIAWALLVVGALSWGLIAVTGLDFVSLVFGPGSDASRVVFLLQAVAGLYAISIPFRMRGAGRQL